MAPFGTFTINTISHKKFFFLALRVYQGIGWDVVLTTFPPLNYCAALLIYLVQTSNNISYRKRCSSSLVSNAIYLSGLGHNLSQYCVRRDETSHRVVCVAPLDEFLVKEKPKDLFETVVQVAAIDYSTSESHFDVYIFVDGVQVHPITARPAYGHIPDPGNDIRNTFPVIQHIPGFFWETEVKDEVERYRDAPPELLSALKLLAADLAWTEEMGNTIDVIVTRKGYPPNLDPCRASPNLATFSFHCMPISRILKNLVGP